jgi:hypothetical protein
MPRRLRDHPVESPGRAHRLLSWLQGAGLALLALTGISDPVFSQACKSSGGLRFLGTTRDESRTVWLSGTVAGSYRLEAAQGNTTVDNWNIARPRGLHVSVSPFVSQGSGGTHRLFDTGGGKDCLVDTQNQKGGIFPILPPNFTLPTTLPARILPSPFGPTPPDPSPPGPTPPGPTPPGPTPPDFPGAVTLPSGVAVSRRAEVRPSPPCIDPRREQPRPGETICSEVPLTPGRDLLAPSPWNVWTQVSYVGVSDRRFGLDIDSRAGSATFGLDRRLHQDVVLGVSASVQESRSRGFGDMMQFDTTGFSIGPYLAVRLSPHWAMDASLGFGRVRNEVDLAVLSGSYSPEVYSGNLTLRGHYDLAGVSLRPKVALYYSHVRNPSHDLAGTVLGFPVSVTIPQSTFNTGIVEPSAEISTILPFSGGAYLMPYVEFGVQYAFERPNGGEMLAGDLSTFVPSAWTGFVRPGLRMSIANALLVELAGGYLSIGHKGLDVWEGKLRVSYGF